MTETSVFTKIRNGEIPGEIIYEDDWVFVIMTIAPHNPGHCLVIPIKETANFEDVPKARYDHMMRVVRWLAQLERQLYKSPKVAMIAAGMEVEHTHIHVFPLYSETDIAFTSAKHPEFSMIQEEAQKLRVAISERPFV